MIRRLRLRFVAVIMSFLTVIFAAIVSGFNYFHYAEGMEQTHDYLQAIIYREGKFHFTKNSDPDSALFRYCYLALDPEFNIVSTVTSSSIYTPEQIDKLLNTALSNGSDFDKICNHYQFLLSETSSGYSIAFLDITRGIESFSQLLYCSILTAAGILALLILICILLSKWLVRPVQLAFERQKEFISDASHELKTPLSVISANADVLADEIGENQFLSYIQSETKQMSHLVQDLLTLTRLDSAATEPPKELDLSQAVLQAALPFESTAFEAGKTLSIDVDDEVHISGYAGKIRQLVAILLDNAIKYSNENGTISLQLSTQRGNPVLEVYNTGEGIPPSEHQKIFQRFYRGDASRHRESGSYGLGLPIAQSIAVLHKARIIVEGEPGKFVRFRVIF